MKTDKCPRCSKSVDPGTAYCPFCGVQIVDLQPLEHLQTLEKPMSGIASKLVEYRRTCQVCGKVWHSLVERENQIARNIKSSNCHKGLAACTCSPSGNIEAAQLTRNIEANEGELMRLRNCPQCSSANYKEEVIEYANQP